jgi:UDP-N-acetyl-D-glucosamine/UDP-N-acetyl-D-galactosamine dehydrogenase
MTCIAVIGLGYVGLPVALGFAEHFPGTIGFDISKSRVEALKNGKDITGEASTDELKATKALLTTDPEDLKQADIFVVCVPTPIYDDNRPDLRPLESASTTVAKAMRKGAIVVYESTVYPGLTEDYCGGILAKVSGLKQGVDFKLGYSPERINPGDKEHTFKKIVKVVAGEDEATAKVVADIYGAVVSAGIHVAPSIKVAETAKVLENTQRDLNIALMNELAIICDLMSIRTKDVLSAAGTKWNFLNFMPGLVGGHCIGVDPYYLTSRAQELGYEPEVILAGRRLNDSMGRHVARRTLQLLGDKVEGARVGLMGLTFKENVPDIRNSRVPDILAELKKSGIRALVCDPFAQPSEVKHEYNITLDADSALKDLDALILAVPHREFLADPEALFARLKPGGVFVDVKSALSPKDVPSVIRYWSL